MCAQAAAQCLARDRAEVGKHCAPKCFIQSVCVRADLLYGKPRREPGKQRAERRLCRRAEDGGRVVILHKLRDGRQARQQIVRRDRLRFVKDDNAIRNVVQFAAAAAAIGVK